MSIVLRDALIIVLLVIANGVFAMAEIAVVTARTARLQERAERGDTRARVALELAGAPNRFLSTVQIGITLIGIFAGAFGGVTIGRAIGAGLQNVPYLAPYSDAIGLAIVVVATTYLSLVIGELVPKRIALTDPEAVASFVAKPMRWLSTLAAPAVTFLSVSTDAVVKMLRVRPSEEPPVTEEEIRVLLERGAQAGIFEEVEQDIVERALRLDERRIDTIMTPRTRIIWLDVNDPPEVNRQKIVDGGRSRYPVCDDILDDVLGIVRVRDLFSQTTDTSELDLEEAMFRPLFVIESMRALRVLELFREHRVHIALVLDEFGAIEGLITMNDILEAIVGDVPGSDEHEEPYAIQRDDGSWLLDGLLPIVDLKELFDIDSLPIHEKGDYHTLAGFVVTRLGRVPSAADRFIWRNLQFEVVDMDGNRVDKVLVVPLNEQDESAET